MLAMDVWCFSKSTARIDLEKHQTRLHYWGISLCNFGESPLQFWVFLLYTKQAEAVRARYRFAMETDPERKQITTVDILSDLDMPHYDSLAYQEFSRICYDGGDPMAFKEFTDSMVQLAKGIDDGRY